MYLKTLTLKDFAGLGETTIDAFEPGLNVVVGDNEAGKSTLLTALRAAFFQKHRATGEAAKALAPYGRQVRPEITIGFDLRGTSYTLRKSFLQRAEAELSWPGGALSSDAVEERLAELLGFAHPGRGESKLGEHQGAFGLLWVEQGRSHEHDLNLGVGRNAVTASLDGEIGLILGGERGRALLAAAKARQDRFFTDTGRVFSRSPLKEAEDALEALRRELAEKQAARRDDEEKIERLSRRRGVLQSYLRDDAVGEAERAVQAAEAEARALSGYERAHGEASRDLDHAEARRAGASERLAARRRLFAAAEEAEGAHAAALAALEDLRRDQTADRAELARLGGAREAARLDLQEAEKGDEAAASRAERLRLRAEIAALEDRLGKVAAVADELAALRRAEPPYPIGRPAVDALEAAERARREAEIRLSASAPTITFEPLAGRSAKPAGGGPAAAAGLALPVVGRAVFDLDGFGRLTVEPGGDADDLGRAHREAVQALEALKARHRVVSSDEARGRLRAEEERQSGIGALARQCAALLPEGIETAGAALATLKARLAAHPAAAHGDAIPDVADADGPLDWRQRRRAAQAELASADAALEAARRVSAAMVARLARSEAECEHRAAGAAALRRDLAEAGHQRAEAALHEDLAACELDRSAKAAVLAVRRRELDEADSETVTRSLQAKRRALEEIRRTVAGLKDETAALEGELRARGASSLGEDIARLGGEIEALDGRRKRLALEAEAARLLHSTLLSAQRQAREHWLGPIKAQVAPFLRLIHPESEIAFDDATLAITGLHRRGVEEEFKRLSAGAREQVAVVTRLALAQVLKRGGHPAAVILDDALVNTDEARLQRMHMVLQKAAEGLQIIVLTCRERDFRGIGAKMFRL